MIGKVKRVLGREVSYHFPRPHRATLAMTERCNLKCRSCGVWQLPARPKDELDLDTMKRVLGELRDLGVESVSLIEGEPLLRREIVEVIQAITDLGMKSDVTTNGVLISEARAEALVAAGLGCLVVSLDAPNEVHDQLRGVPGVFAKALTGIRRTIAARKAAGSATPTVFVNTVLSLDNIGFLNDWVDFLLDLEVTNLNFLYPTFVPPEVDAAANINGEKVSSGRFVGFDHELIIPPDRMAEVLVQLRALRASAAKRGLEVWLSPDLYLSDPEHLAQGLVPTQRCAFTRDMIIVDPYGGIMPCALLDKFSYGSVLEQPVSEVWMNERHRMLLQKVKEGMDMCKYCGCHFGSNLTLGQQVKRTLLSNGPLAAAG